MSEFYVPIFRNQIGDPTTTRDGVICTMSSGAMALDFHTLGAIQRWGGELEQHQGDHVGGTDLGDLADAWAYYGQNLSQGTGGWTGVEAALAAGKAVVLQGDYDRIPDANSCQRGFDGDHAIALFPTTGAWARVGDPLCDGFHLNWPEAAVKAYAEKLAGAGKARFAMSAAHPAQASGWVLKLAPKAPIRIVATWGAGTPRCIKTWVPTTYWFDSYSSAPCAPPEWHPGCSSGSAVVAFVTAGKYKGQYLRLGVGVTAVKT